MLNYSLFILLSFRLCVFLSFALRPDCQYFASTCRQRTNILAYAGHGPPMGILFLLLLLLSHLKDHSVLVTISNGKRYREPVLTPVPQHFCSVLFLSTILSITRCIFRYDTYSNFNMIKVTSRNIND